MTIMIGIDPHKATHTAVAVDREPGLCHDAHGVEVIPPRSYRRRIAAVLDDWYRACRREAGRARRRMSAH